MTLLTTVETKVKTNNPSSANKESFLSRRTNMSLYLSVLKLLLGYLINDVGLCVILFKGL